MKNALFKFKTIIKVDISIKPTIRIVVTSFVLALLAGCVGAMVESLAYSQVTGQNFSETKAGLPSPAAGNGRLYIYRTEASTGLSFEYGIGFVRNPVLCTVDDDVYEIIWEAFRYFDLPTGQHEITCGEDVVDISKDGVFSLSRGRHFQRGKNKIHVLISEASETFLRVDVTAEKPHFEPISVKAEQAQKEISDLPYQKTGFGVIDTKITQ